MFDFKDEKGSITIFLVIIVFVLILLIGLLVDLGRIKIAQSQLRRATNVSARSVLADYDTALRKEYGLFSINKSDLHKEFNNYIKANLSIPANQEFYLLDYRIEGSSLSVDKPLHDTNYLRKQILEDMKYTAPVEITSNLLDKFSPVGQLAQFYSEQNEKRKIYKNINKDLQQIGELDKDIAQSKGKIVKYKQQLENVRRRLEYEINANTLKMLRRKEKDLIKKIDYQKNAITNLLIQADNIVRQAEKKIKQLEAESTRSIYEIKDAKGNKKISQRVKKNKQQIKSTNVDPLKADLVKIKRDIRKAKERVGDIKVNDHHVNKDVLSEISVPSINEALQRLNISSPNEITVNNADKAELEADERYYRDIFEQNDTFKGESVPFEQVSGKVDKFDEDENDQRTNDHVGLVENTFKIINVKKKLIDLRDELFINEYALKYFSCLTGEPKGAGDYKYKNTEIEYVLYNSNLKGEAIAQLYGTRFALDTLAYFTFSKKAPLEFISRSIYSLMMGAMQASVDTYKLLADREVSVVEMLPASDNLLSEVTVNYKDHLRLFLVLKSLNSGFNSEKLNRIKHLIEARKDSSLNTAYTSANGEVEVSIEMWFLTLAGIDDMANGPFGTRIKDGRCYIKKSVEFSY